MNLSKLKIVFYIFFLSLLFGLNASAQADDLIVIFNPNPLFGEINFSPGAETAGRVEVGNKSGEGQLLAVEAIGVDDPDMLGDVFNLIIRENEQNFFNGSLTSFFNAGQILLTSLAKGASTTYEFIISFDALGEDELQGKILNNFDIRMGFWGEGESNAKVETSVSSGGGTGGWIRLFDLPIFKSDLPEIEEIFTDNFSDSVQNEVNEEGSVAEVGASEILGEADQEQREIIDEDFDSEILFLGAMDNADEEDIDETREQLPVKRVAGIAAERKYQPVVWWVFIVILCGYLFTLGLYYILDVKRKFKYGAYFPIVLSGIIILLVWVLMGTF